MVLAKGSQSGEEGKPRQVWNIHWQQIRTLQAGCQQSALFSYGMSPQNEISVKFWQLFWKPQKSIWMFCCFPHLFLLSWEQKAADGHQSYELWGLRALSWPLGTLLGEARLLWSWIQSLPSLAGPIPPNPRCPCCPITVLEYAWWVRGGERCFNIAPYFFDCRFFGARLAIWKCRFPLPQPPGF